MTLYDKDEVTMTGASIITNDTFMEENGLSDKEKRKRIDSVYSNGRWMEEDDYEVIRVRKIVRSHIFSKVKFCKGEGKTSVNNFDKKTAKIIKFGISHEKTDLRKKTGYAYAVMKMVGYDELNKSITERALWWKSYLSLIHI